MVVNTYFRVGKNHITIENALALSRTLPTSVPRTIEIVGELNIVSPIELDARDGSLTILGGCISGGIKVDAWEEDPHDARLIRARLPQGATPRMLIVNGRAQRLSVYPDSSFLELKDEPQNLKWLNSVNGGWSRMLSVFELTHIHIDPEQIPKGVVPGSTEVRVYHSWDESTVPVKDIDRESGEITLSSAMTHPAGSFGKKNLQFLNIREGMTDPGCWYFDADEGYVYYYPEVGAQSFSAVIPFTETLIRMNGVKGVTLKDIELSYCGSPRISSGLRSANLAGTVDIADSNDILLSSLKIHDSAGHGIKLLGTCRHRIENCEIFNMGGGGIFTHACSGEHIVGNRISDIGLIAYSSVGIHAGGRSMLVWVLEGKPNECGQTVISSNIVERSPYCAITCSGKGHIIENNKVVDFMQRLSDGAGIYVSRGNRTVVRRNRAESNLSGRPNKSYYFDEGGYRCLCESNESYGVESAYGDHRCRKMTVRKNRFSSARELYLVLNNCRDYKISENVFEAGGRFIIAVPRDGIDDIRRLVLYLKRHFKFEKNLLRASSDVPLVVGYGEQIEAPQIKVD